MASWYKGYELEWLSPEEFSKAGYNIELGYKPIFSAEYINSNFDEDYEGYYKRGATISKGMYDLLGMAAEFISLVTANILLTVWNEVLSKH